MSNFEIDAYMRFTMQDLLLQQLFVQFASITDDPDGVLSDAEETLVKVFSAIKPPAAGIEEKHIRLLQIQREHGPDLVRDFFRKARKNLPTT
jgi:hypothetical protein